MDFLCGIIHVYKKGVGGGEQKWLECKENGKAFKELLCRTKEIKRLPSHIKCKEV